VKNKEKTEGRKEENVRFMYPRSHNTVITQLFKSTRRSMTCNATCLSIARSSVKDGGVILV
jgi:hypothetical protein